MSDKLQFVVDIQISNASHRLRNSIPSPVSDKLKFVGHRLLLIHLTPYLFQHPFAVFAFGI
jgi:hypothetical protein